MVEVSQEDWELGFQIIGPLQELGGAKGALHSVSQVVFDDKACFIRELVQVSAFLATRSLFLAYSGVQPYNICLLQTLCKGEVFPSEVLSQQGTVRQHFPNLLSLSHRLGWSSLAFMGHCCQLGRGCFSQRYHPLLELLIVLRVYLPG